MLEFKNFDIISKLSKVIVDLDDLFTNDDNTEERSNGPSSNKSDTLIRSNYPKHKRKNIPMSSDTHSISISTQISFTLNPSDFIGTDSINYHFDKSYLIERNCVMFNNSLMSNVVFIVGRNKDKFYAHKYILSITSPVFYAMLYGPLKDVKQEILVPDIEKDPFEAILRYIYYDHQNFTEENVIGILYGARKYLINHLAVACLKYINMILNPENVCHFFNQRILLHESLTRKCLDIIDTQAQLVLSSNGFKKLDYSSLEIILSRDTLNVKEIILFKAVLEWSKNECLRKGLQCTPSNQRKVLDKIFYLIRMTAIDPQDFTDGPYKSGLLTDEEIKNISNCFNSSQLKMNINPRKGKVFSTCNRYSQFRCVNNRWFQDDSIDFSVDKSIFLAGYGIYGPSASNDKIKVVIEIKDGDDLLERKTGVYKSNGFIFRILFDNPIYLKAYVLYTASVILENSHSNYLGINGFGLVKVSSVTFTFQESTNIKSGTTMNEGQIPELLFFNSNE